MNIHFGATPRIDPTDDLIPGFADTFPWTVNFPVGRPLTIGRDEHRSTFHVTLDQAEAAVAQWHAQQERARIDAQDAEVGSVWMQAVA